MFACMVMSLQALQIIFQFGTARKYQTRLNMVTDDERSNLFSGRISDKEKHYV
jgi:hypothetical protein